MSVSMPESASKSLKKNIMKTIYRLIVLGILLLLFEGTSQAQIITQSIKGKITDEDSRSEIIGATVVIANSNPLLGGATGVDGQFRIDDVPIGRVTLLISSIGYKERVLPNIEIGSGKELYLEITMQEHIAQLDEIVINARENQSEINNEMAMVSARSFSVEETKRYAGAFNDPARMVSNYAGVQGSADESNYIAVRGNSPTTVQWKLDGIAIPNPNHFTEEGEAGGGINVLNSAMLSNSDFYTGAFSPGYGNVMGAVFDMRLRQGNQDKREYSFSAGILGIDFTLEGPFSKKGKSSYLVNYRYSTLAILDDLGIVDFGGVPKYQDLSFKFRFPTKNAGIFTLFGLGGISGVDEQYVNETGETEATGKYGSKLGTINLHHLYFFNANSSLESYISLSQNGSTGEFNKPINNPNIFEKRYSDNLDKYTLQFNTAFNTKINARNTFRTGIMYSQFYFDFNQKIRNDEDILETWLDDKANTGLAQAYATWKHRWNENLAISGGLHYSYTPQGNSGALEPRLSAKYKWNQQSITAGVGLHSQMPSLPVYYSQVPDDQGNSTQPNLNLGLMRAMHYVLGYDRLITSNLYFKAEVYYQSLFDIPVENELTSTYSLLNATGGYTYKSLVNGGSGSNYGIELTLERYFQNDYFFMFTGSFYESKYQTLENVERNTQFNGNYITNGLIGKEFHVGDPTKNKIVSLSTKAMYSGGLRYTPINLEESQEAGHGVYDEQLAFTERSEPIIKIDLAAAYRWNKRKTRQEIKLDIQNVTNNAANVSQFYNSETEEIVFGTQWSIFPVISYTIQF